MSALKTLGAIEMLLNIHYNGEDADAIKDNTAVWRCSRDWLLENGLIELSNPIEGKTYRTTNRGIVYAEAIRELPLPEQVWMMPPNAGSGGQNT